MLASRHQQNSMLPGLRTVNQATPLPSSPLVTGAADSRGRLRATIACVGKGGSGKSSVITNLAVAGLSAGIKVGIIDADPQQSAYLWKRVRARNDIPVCRAGSAELERPIESARRAGIEFLLIDMPPDLWQVPSTARHADLVLIPMRPTLFDLKVTRSLVRILESASRSYGVILNSAPPIREAGESPMVRDARKALKDLQSRVWQGQITNRVTAPHATVRGSGVVEFEPAGPAAREFRSLWAAVSNTKQKGSEHDHA